MPLKRPCEDKEKAKLANKNSFEGALQNGKFSDLQ